MTLPQQPDETVILDAALNEVLDAELEAIMQKDREDSALYEKRKRRSKRIIFWALAFVTVGSLLGFVALYFYLFWKDYVTDYDKYGSHTAQCIFKVGERTVQGTRTYGYRYMTVLGHKIYMTQDTEVEEETRLDIAGNGMTIMMQKRGEPMAKEFISDGEKMRKLLPRANSYIFFMDGGKNTASISYKDLCK